MVQAVMNDCEAPARKTEEFYDVARGVFADRDNRILPPGKPAGDHPAIEHPLPIIFIGDVERRQVMDGGNEAAGFGPEQTTVAGNVEDIELMPAREFWQSGLMPENVFDRQPEALRYRNQLHLTFDEGEEGQILFQGEQDKLMFAGVRQEGAQKREHVLRNT